MNDSASKIEAGNDIGWEWALVEIMGHRSHWGRVREEERFGAKMLRIDVPSFQKTAELGVVGDVTSAGIAPAQPQIIWTTHYYGGPSIFSFTLTDEATVMKRNRPYEPAHRLTYRAPVPQDDDVPFDAGYGEDDA